MVQLDYEPRPTKGGTDRPSPIVAAYLLAALPCLTTSVLTASRAQPPSTTIAVFVTVAIAVGAGLFIVRRRPRDRVGWAALVVWGGFVLLALGSAVL